MSVLLRDVWKFKGFVVSDANAIHYIQHSHQYRNTPEDTVTEAITAGVNLELATKSHAIFQHQVSSDYEIVFCLSTAFIKFLGNA